MKTDSLFRRAPRAASRTLAGSSAAGAASTAAGFSQVIVCAGAEQLNDLPPP